jgi:very-short-patch-repair endonuclease
MRPKLAHPDQRVALVAARQHAVVGLDQLYRAGLTPDAVKHRVRSGRLHRIHRGVYALGRAELTLKGRWKAATLALGDGAALSHRSAAELWGMFAPRSGSIDVTVRSRTGRARRAGIRLHRSFSLTGAVTTPRDGIAVTRPQRTLTDLRRVVAADELRDAIRAAEIAGMPIGDYAKLTERTRSELELRFLYLVRRRRLPEPEINVRVGPYLVDFLWRSQRLVVETDGERFHRGELAAAEDRARDDQLRAFGFEILRFGRREVMQEPHAVAALVRARLEGRGIGAGAPKTRPSRP